MSKEKEESKLDKLKEDYSKIQKKHDLPSFEKLNEDFQIEKLADTETDFLIREVRKVIGDKMANYMRFAEMMLNPSNAGMFAFSMVKAMDTESKDKITEVYKKLSGIELDFIELDTIYSEKKESSFIKEGFEMWQEVKKKTIEILDSVRKNWNNKSDTSSKKYFG